MNKYKTIYVEVDEEITSVIERIKKTPSNNIAVVVSTYSDLTLGIINLRILKSQSEKIGKKIILITKDPLSLSLAKKIGLLAKNKLTADLFGREETALNSSKSVKKTATDQKVIQPNTIDLRISSPKIDPKEIKPLNGSSEEKSTQNLEKLDQKEIKENVLDKKSSINRLENYENLDQKNNSLVKEKANNFKLKTDNKNNFFAFLKIFRFLFNLKIIIVLLIFFGIGYLSLMTFHFNQAEVEVSLKREEARLESNVILAKSFSEIDFNNQIIPLVTTEETLEAEIQVPATGALDDQLISADKVFGNLVVYNEYSTSPEVLIAGTRFSSSDGLIYKANSRINLAGAKNVDGTLVPSETIVSVIAEKTGQEYYKESGHLTVPGLKDTDRYDKIYAEIQEPLFQPGENEPKVVTQEDIETAKEKAKEELKKIYLAKYQDSELKIVDSSIEFFNLEYDSNESLGKVVNRFNFKVKADLQAPAYSKVDLNKLVTEILNDKLSLIYELKGDLNIEVKETTRIDNSKINLTLLVLGQKQRQVEEKDLKKSILGYSKEDAVYKLKSLDYIDKVTINFQPFWLKEVPTKEEKVKIMIKE
jgi:hypothetical protein